MLHRVLQAYLATAQTAETIVTDADLDYRDDLRVRFLIDNLIDAAAPSNNPILSPVAWKSAIDTGGTSLLRGAANLARDMAAAPRIPTMVEPSAFEVGQTLAVTPGAVVRRTAVFELIQYTPQTERVRTVPLLIVPPVINKYYAIDLAPGRSLIEYLVVAGSAGVRHLVAQPRRPPPRPGASIPTPRPSSTPSTRCWTSQTSSRPISLALCSGGVIASMLAAYLAQTGGIDKVASLGLAVTVLDQSRAGMASALIDERVAKMAVAASARRGYLDGRSLAEVFAWLRPNDLIWNYWVNNYLQGKQPPAFDVLYWNADTTRMAAHLHRDFIDLAMSNALVTPGAATMLGQPVDLSKVTVDSYVVAGVADHLCPWQSCYATTQMLGGKSRFVLSNSGHIAALVNPPSNPKATFQSSDDNVADADEWRKTARAQTGSWWPDYANVVGRAFQRGERGARRGSVHRASPLSRPRRARMCSTVETTRVVNVAGQDLRVRIRPGVDGAAPLVLCCGLGAGFDVLQPFVDALDPAIEVVRFDVPGVGGSPAGRVPYGFPGNACMAVQDAPAAGVLGRRCTRAVVGWGTGPADGIPVSPLRPSPRPGQHRHRLDHGSWAVASAGQDGDDPPVQRSVLCRLDHRRYVRRHRPHPSRPGPATHRRRHAPGIPGRLRPPVAGRRRLDQLCPGCP